MRKIGISFLKKTLDQACEKLSEKEPMVWMKYMCKMFLYWNDNCIYDFGYESQ